MQNKAGNPSRQEKAAMLTPQQREQFITEGHIVLKGVFSRDDSLAWVRDECAYAGYDVDDPATWQKPYERLNLQRHEPLETYAPAAWEASCDLMGGETRVANKPVISLFAMNFKQGADQPFQPASASSPGWHKDGWHFRHFLDGPEQGLLGIPLFTDVQPQGGATFIVADSVGAIARFLAAHPEGVGPDDFDTQALLSECHDFREATGEAGDVYLLHPYLLHAVSQNCRQEPRAITNLCYEFKEPMNFHRADGDYSPVEAAVLRGLGVDHYDFQLTGERYRTPDYGPMNQKYR
jgi:ectoine hydroxylase-related dioxygenase (phytanoyl-CoA dioxygenase family)